ncbi:hypothetical protein CRV08_01445 [Halarcobacter ebronensis]|uniref:Uncharacterized protein n=1 Tax=Halarcobacter ebronensis TaxID=1462615 RepID=A0A4Q0YIV0_9BACT|nr:hypothetical protein [Halarcobacter ebronensis]RXJ70255.1 hypothetical protein CRV08_01445 [Halarcobacter ebronensis]
MDASVLLALRDPAGIPFYPVVFQVLYVLTWALHAAFVLLALGSMGLSLYGTTKQKDDPYWKILTPHLIQTGKLSVSILIVLGVAPLLFTQVIYDPNWYVANTLSGMWVFIFIYTLLVGYTMYYWYYYANRAKEGGGKLIGLISFLILVFAGVLMHNFAVTSIMPNEWMEMYAPNGVVDNSGWTFNIDLVRLIFIVSLAIPVIGIFLQNYSRFLSTRKDFEERFVDYCAVLGTRIGVVGLLISAVTFVIWMLSAGYLMNPVSIAIIVGVVILLLMVYSNSNSYITTGVLVVVALLISSLREVIRFDIMTGLGYNIYDYPVNLEIPTITMFLLTFLIMGGIGVAYLLTMSWKVGKINGVFDGSKDKAVTRLGNYTLSIMVVWMVIYFGWGMFILFNNIL